MRYVYRGQKNTVLGTADKSPAVYKIIITVLTLIIIGLVFFILFAKDDFSKEKYTNTVLTVANSEMKQAITQAENLSRSATSGTATTLGKVRQYVHSLETLNSVNILILGQSGRIYPQQVLETTQGIIDSYSTQLQTGQPTAEVLSKLLENLKMLSETTNALQLR